MMGGPTIRILVRMGLYGSGSVALVLLVVHGGC